jgi:cobalamin-dependent methionine synthase I
MPQAIIMGVLAPFDYTIRNMGIKLPDAKMVSLFEEMERAGITNFSALLRLSNEQLKLFLPSLNLGDRVIVRTCAESEVGITILAHYMRDLVIRLQRSPFVMSAELLSAFESRGDDDEDRVRWSHAALELRAQGILKLPVLLSVALMDDGDLEAPCAVILLFCKYAVSSTTTYPNK